MTRRLLLVHAHPDDESLWTGGVIAKYVAEGARVTVVTCTLGEEGEVITPELQHLEAAAADQLGGYRMSELQSALAALDVADHRWLGVAGRWRDSGMVDEDANYDERAFVAGDFAEQVAALGAIMDEVRPQVVVTYNEIGGYGHPDHIRAHEITVAAAREKPYVQRIFYAVNAEKATNAGLAELAGLEGVPWPVPTEQVLPTVPDETITTFIDIAEYQPQRLAALSAHATQVSVWQDKSYSLSNNIAQPVLVTEYYILAYGPAKGSETDLFDGLDLG